ncbi:MAG TPA: XRE family transcriptional regulator [Euzebyales bacterium]|nr:XRE family transcriptional regulator [Euzebyales bacterium]
MQEPEVLAAAIGRNVRRLRRRRDLTLDQLAERAGVSKGTVIGVEQSRANPSIATLCRIADALGVGVVTLIDPGQDPQVRIKRGTDTPTLWTSKEGSRALFLMGTDPPDIVELWDWRLAPGDTFDGGAHPEGTVELLHVLEGVLAVRIGTERHELMAGDTILFDAVLTHSYDNPGDRPNRFFMSVVQRGDAHLVPPGDIGPVRS